MDFFWRGKSKQGKGGVDVDCRSFALPMGIPNEDRDCITGLIHCKSSHDGPKALVSFGRPQNLGNLLEFTLWNGCHFRINSNYLMSLRGLPHVTIVLLIFRESRVILEGPEQRNVDESLSLNIFPASWNCVTLTSSLLLANREQCQRDSRIPAGNSCSFSSVSARSCSSAQRFTGSRQEEENPTITESQRLEKVVESNLCLTSPCQHPGNATSLPNPLQSLELGSGG